MKDFGRQSQKSKYIVLTYDVVLPLIVISLLIVGAIVALKTNVFAIKAISCRLDYQECPVGPVMAELEKYLGNNMLKQDTDVIRDRLTAGDFTIREATITKKLPNTLIVDLQSVFPVVSLRVAGVDNEWVVFDHKYRVISVRNSDPNVPTVLIETTPILHVGETMTDPAIVKAFDLSIYIAGEISSVETISLAGTTLTLELDGGKQALLTTEKDKAVQIRTLQAILAENTIKIGEVRTIDVRFSKPVLR